MIDAPITVSANPSFAPLDLQPLAVLISIDTDGSREEEDGALHVGETRVGRGDGAAIARTAVLVNEYTYPVTVSSAAVPFA